MTGPATCAPSIDSLRPLLDRRTSVQDSRSLDALVDLLRVVDAEIADWEAPYVEPGAVSLSPATRHPEAAAPGGLPEGWDLVASLDDGAEAADMHLVTRRAGGALILRRSKRTGNTSTMWFNVTVAEMYRALRDRRDGVPLYGARRATAAPGLGPVVAWQETVLVAMYDPTDEAEAGERVLVGLGAPFTVLPAAAHVYGDALLR